MNNLKEKLEVIEFVLYRIWTKNHRTEYHVMESNDYGLEKSIDRDLCHKTISVSSDKTALEMAVKELNNLCLIYDI